MNCCAIIATRNEAEHLNWSIDYYVRQGIDVVVIDHGSSDSTVAVCNNFLGRGLIRVVQQQWHGSFNLAEQLEIKLQIIAGLTHDWVIHSDSDEWLQSSRHGETLVDGIRRLDSHGFNVINFEEFVFLPTLEQQAVPAAQCRSDLLHYYYFVPAERRLMRAWKRAAGLSNKAAGGHQLTGGHIALADENFALRHYIVLSQPHAAGKYVGRKFHEGDLARGWHLNRVGVTPEMLTLPQAKSLMKLPEPNSQMFDRSNPRRKHYWEWDSL